LTFAKLVRVEFLAHHSDDRRMLELLIVVVGALTLALRGHRELVLEHWRCGTNWRPSTERRDAAFGHATDSSGWLSRAVGETGAPR
jgi:hypothetical protein